MSNSAFSDNWLSELRAKNDIISVISKYVKLDRKGKNFWACCPFHHERTPSFAVNEMEQFYHCFGCGESGDVIKFVRKIESCDFLQAVEILCKNAGMEMPSNINGEDIAKKKKQKEEVLKILNDAKQHYKDNLYLKTSIKPQNYIKMRQLTKKELDTFELGFSSDWDEMVKYLKSKRYSYELMQQAGLVEKGNNGGYYDVFGGRLIFPIHNIYGDCVGFSARVLEKSDFAKYKNSPNTIVFDKSKLVYGINIVRELKRKEKLDRVVIVEGQMDVIAMHKAGFSNAVACLGTAFTPDHAKQLRLLAEEVVVCLDGDSAGLKAAYKCVDVLADNGFNVKVAVLDNGKDPDEYIKEYGKESLENKIKNAVDYITFKIYYQSIGIDFNKPEQKNKFVRSALEIINKIPTFSEKQVYLEKVKEMANVPIDVLTRDVLKTDSEIINSKTINNSDKPLEDSTQRAIKFILASLLNKESYANFEEDLTKYLKNDSFLKLYNFMKQKRENGEPYTISMLFGDDEEFENDLNLQDIINYNLEEIGNKQKYYKESWFKLKELDYKKELEDLTKRYKDCTDINQRKDITKNINEILRLLKNKGVEE